MHRLALCETITCSNGSSSRARSAGNARCSCDGEAQTRSSPFGAVSVRYVTMNREDVQRRMSAF